MVKSISRNLIVIGIVAGMVALFLHSCTEDIIQTNTPDTPFNPYDTIDYSNHVVPPVPIDSANFLGLYTYIFKKKCGVPACHDGSFEPDFRTVESAYNTLVFHPVVKFYDDSFYTFRVLPGDTNQSWLHERLTTKDLVLGRMPLYDQPLNAKEMSLIENWILSGAPDMWGRMPMYPDFQPNAFGLLAYLPDAGNMRVDSIRYNDLFYYPFLVPHNYNVKLWIGFYDLDSYGDFQFPNYFTSHKIKMSVNKPYDFGNSMELTLTEELLPFIGPTLYGFDAPYHYHVTFNSSMFNVGDIVYIRAYVNDGNHAQDTELPDAASQFFVITLFSFIVV